jgi:hypothetical protein
MPPTSFDPDSLAFKRCVIVAIACVLAIWAGALLTEQPYLIFAALLGLIYVGTLTVNCRALAGLVIALQPAALIVPFFPGRPFWWELCALLAWPSLLAFALVNRRALESLRLDRLERRALLALLGYMGVLAFLMLYRGVGLRVLGGEQMGGRVYAQQLVLAILPALMVVARFSPRQLVGALIAGWLLSLTYVVSEFSFNATGGAMHPLLYFLELPTDGLNFNFSYDISGVRRFGSLAAVCAAGLACLWISAPLRALLGRWLLVAGPLMLALIGVGLGSGYRNVFLTAVLTLFFLALFQRFWDLRRTIAALVLSGLLVAGLYATADRLPLSVQRAVSFFPGIAISPIARADATATNLDRWEVMKLALHDVPRFAVVGRGFGMGRIDQAPLDPASAGVALLYAQGMFYNGVVGTLLKTGVPGLIFSLLFVGWVSRLALELVGLVRRRGAEAWTIFDRVCLLLCAQWFAVLMLFYITNGDVAWWMQFFGLPAGLILAARRLQLAAIEAGKPPPASAFSTPPLALR